MPLVLLSTSACSDHTFGDLDMVSSQSSEEREEESLQGCPEAPGAVLRMVGEGFLVGAPGAGMVKPPSSLLL